ncbi:hypothetical protein HGT73_13425 [Rosenbergiella australiborealis]|uniref:Uncharacterized protein n=1 Tax=Rosenbergiella australiborealis TaxID=1544696 RepID=A0ABS5T7K2_9GAMM|nr:hypothetical protein [Rosenbergiella australiborealis]MBT0728349.1 hypothetical protein [Rosenbergiella australiborealis]
MSLKQLINHDTLLGQAYYFIATKYGRASNITDSDGTLTQKLEVVASVIDLANVYHG